MIIILCKITRRILIRDIQDYKNAPGIENGVFCHIRV